MAQILIYTDKGVDGEALKQLYCSLKQTVHPQYVIKRIDSKKLVQEEWEKETALLIVPGGRDVFYHDALDGVGTEKIRTFVQEGGSYLGICAGAYFASSSIEFEKGEALEVCAERSLKFFPGVAKGPAYGARRYSYESKKGVEAALISWKEKASHIYFNGGCFFDQETSDRFGIKVLSRYLDLQHQPPAIVQTAFGKGRVILSGVHLEYAPFFTQEDPHLAKILPLLKQAEDFRSKVFREVIDDLLHFKKDFF